MYDENMIQPMRQEMIDGGFQEARTSEDVDAVLAEQGTSLFFVNSVCGCAAGVARPGILGSLDSEILPDRLVTSFAGNDVEAVNRAREAFAGYPPSSPCAALVRDGQVVYMVERHHIEGHSADNVSQVLKSVYAKFCGSEIDEGAEIFDPKAALECTVEDVQSKLGSDNVAVLDVREPWEIQGGMIEGAISVDQDKAREIIEKWPRDREIIVYCEHGNRSVQAAQFFQSHGFGNVKSMAGGYSRWNTA